MPIQVLSEDVGHFSEQLLQVLDLLCIQITFNRDPNSCFSENSAYVA